MAECVMAECSAGPSPPSFWAQRMYFGNALSVLSMVPYFCLALIPLFRGVSAKSWCEKAKRKQIAEMRFDAHSAGDNERDLSRRLVAETAC